jgi:hypothetical protein
MLVASLKHFMEPVTHLIKDTDRTRTFGIAGEYAHIEQRTPKGTLLVIAHTHDGPVGPYELNHDEVEALPSVANN